eukprot:TRINITY_DN9264_c0_g1_i1.p1 TRINITY_DN9264_c0_g1~~TRINITY_DN9264_c0_g1_i1.p1  ORF type:complete len:1132 (+),score=301.06 TRINITY_DN9264_c0_g1_i1:190-3396(+)
MYVELWCEKQFKSLDAARAATDGRAGMSQPERLQMSEILFRAYRDINEPDALLGLSLLDHDTSLERTTAVMEHGEQWVDALGMYDTSLVVQGTSQAASHVDRRLSVASLLNVLGYHHLHEVYVRMHSSHNSPDAHKFASAQAESLWRSFGAVGGRASGEAGPSGEASDAMDLDESIQECRKVREELSEVQLAVSRGATGFNGQVLSLLSLLQGGRMAEFDHLLGAARHGLAKQLQSVSLEDMKQLNELLVRARMFEDIGRVRADPDSIMEDLSKIPSFDARFANIEPLLALRTSLVRGWGTQSQLDAQLMALCTLAQQNNHIQCALTSLHKRSRNDHRNRWEHCKIQYLRGSSNGAVSHAKILLSQVIAAMPFDNELYGEILACTGRWLSETNTDSASTIISKYFKIALTHCAPKLKIEARYYLASYCDRLYMDMRAMQYTSEWEASCRLRESKERELKECQRAAAADRRGKDSLRTYMHQLQTQVSLDQEETNRFNKDRNYYLELALASYLDVLHADNTHDTDSVFRLCSLWFENKENASASAMIEQKISHIPSAKFIPLVYQIASRLGTKIAHFSRLVGKLMLRMAQRHPFHVVYQLLALVNTSRVSLNRDMDKEQAANAVINGLLKSKVAKVVLAMRDLSDAYIRLAYVDMKAHRNKRNQPKAVNIDPKDFAMQDAWRSLPVATLKFSPQDTEIVYIEGFDTTFGLVGGVNVPKKLHCLGSDGVQYAQLVKGNDDMRQDAVMQQMFEFVNVSFSQRRELRSRQLAVRTYTVVPFSPDAGILQWVANTIPLYDYLVGSRNNPDRGAHSRIRPSDWSFLKCRQYIQEARTADREKKFREICDHYQPVFHHFFLESFSDPAKWFERRLAYTRSVATTSIIGYVLGIGDRHLQNILIDRETAELIHIDFGVAFEQGKTLPQPELVPFRLTQDLIDGMGISGCEGVFRRCCEVTLGALRESPENVLTIAEVFLHDPLLRWKLPLVKARQLQQVEEEAAGKSVMQSSGSSESSDYSGNTTAARALIRIKAKLQGVDSGHLLSVSGQVNALINEARDDSKLANMFRGWSAWV